MRLSNLELPVSFLIISIVLALQAGFNVFGTVSAVRNDAAICTQNRSRSASRYVTFRETYKKRRWLFFKKVATRIAYRWETFIEWYSVEVCCTGYREQRKIPLTCSPVCPSGCPHGACKRPNVCTCNSGYRASLIHGLSNCVPDCGGNGENDDGCGDHGQCTHPAECECHVGYTLTVEKFHSTDKPEYSLPCIPKCEPECVSNAYCRAPNKCQCSAGYRSTGSNQEGDQCLPICEKNCINGICVSPNKCTCLSGYKPHPTDNFMCEPICENRCINGNCTSPNHCECHQGYKKQLEGPPNECSPICDPLCMNANCTQPNHCECHQGYKKDSKGPSQVCLPVCHQSCINGNCTAPNHCECHDGYGKNPDHPTHICSPVCYPPCINAKCTEPNHCECHDGYGKNLKVSSQICSPVCDPPCINADCTEPNHCECYQGYKNDLKNPPQVCAPICDPPCINATCDQPNQCECYDGYKKSSKGPLQSCSPFCEPPCDPHAFCESPNKCVCIIGYIVVPVMNSSSINSWPNSTDNWTTTLLPTSTDHSTTTSLHTSNTKIIKTAITCQPLCEPACTKNASCIAPNVCQCDIGYRSDSSPDQMTTQTQCLPICEKDCVNAFCGHPNKCICLSGYKPSSMDNFVCEPFCEHDCINANCTRPNYCECHDGYKKAEFTPTDANESVIISDNLCIPSCPKKCLSTSCIAPNECICSPGYAHIDTSTDTSEQLCQPLCEPNCPSGLECVAPDQCEPQFGQDQDNSELSTYFPDVVNTTENSSRDDNLFNENSTRVCKYGCTGSSSGERSFCIMIFIADNATDEQFNIVESLTISSNSTDYDESNDENAETMIWRGPMCREQCRISILSSETSGNISEKIIHCRRLEAFNATSDLVSIESRSLISGGENQSIVCLIKADSKCNRLESQMFSSHGTFYGIIGVAVLLVVVASLISAIYLVCRKRRNVIPISDVSMNHSEITEWPDFTQDTLIESSSI